MTGHISEFLNREPIVHHLTLQISLTTLEHFLILEEIFPRNSCLLWNLDYVIDFYNASPET